jgi:hypothetical protein
MRPSFFIFALPRSGTSWLSLFLSGASSYCYHEPTADFTPAQWVEQARKRPEAVVGAVDTAAYRYISRMREVMPEARFFELVREPLEIYTSLERVGLHGFTAGVEHYKLHDAAHAVNAGYIPYPKLRDIGYLEELWGMLIGTSFDRERAQLFLEMRVERDIPLFMANRPNVVSHLRSLRA